MVDDGTAMMFISNSFGCYDAFDAESNTVCIYRIVTWREMSELLSWHFLSRTFFFLDIIEWYARNRFSLVLPSEMPSVLASKAIVIDTTLNMFEFHDCGTMAARIDWVEHQNDWLISGTNVLDVDLANRGPSFRQMGYKNGRPFQ